jgi:hypothetical protein
MVSAFAIFLSLFEAKLMIAEAQNPNSFASVMIVWALRDIGVIVSVVVGGIWAARAKNLQPSS